MKKARYFFFIFLLLTVISKAQTNGPTILEKGDLLVVGVNALNRLNRCSTDTNANPHYDNIFFVSTKKIVNGTKLIITDNRYLLTNSFTTNEGAYELERVGGDILAGNVFRIDFTSGSLAVNGVFNGWKLTNRYNSFGLNNDGDQFFIMQGNGWVNDSYWNNKKNLIAYNSKDFWSNTSDSENSILPTSTNSNLNLKIENFHFTPTDENKLYRFYNGLTSEASSKEWMIRLLNPNNWISFDTTNAQRPQNCQRFINHTNNYTNFQIKDKQGEFTYCKEDVDLPSFVSPIKIAFDSEDETKTIQTKFQWYRVNSDINSGGTLIPGATNRTLSPQFFSLGTHYYYCKITYKLSWKTSANSSISTSENEVPSGYYKVTVNQTQTSPITEIP